MPESLKVAATYSPTMQRSTIGDAGCVGARAALPRPSAALAPLRPPPPVPRASDAFFQPHTPPSFIPTTTSPSWAITLRCSVPSLLFCMVSQCGVPFGHVCFIIGLSLNKVFSSFTSVS